MIACISLEILSTAMHAFIRLNVQMQETTKKSSEIWWNGE